MPDGLAGFYSDGDIPGDSTLSDNKVRNIQSIAQSIAGYMLAGSEFLTVLPNYVQLVAEDLGSLLIS